MGTGFGWQDRDASERRRSALHRRHEVRHAEEGDGPATGQTSLIKGIHAVGYGTPQQAAWFTNLPIAVFALLVLVGWAAKSSGYELARGANGRRLTPNPVFWVIWIALLLGGGHWISLIETGLWTFPDHHPVSG